MKEISREQIVLWAYESGFPTNYARNEITRFETFSRLVERHVKSELYNNPEIDRLNGEVLLLRILTSNQTLYSPTDSGDVWMIEKRKADEFKG